MSIYSNVTEQDDNDNQHHTFVCALVVYFLQYYIFHPI